MKTRAFTLIELLLSIVIFAVILSAINGVFYGAMRLRNRTSQMLERSLSIQQTVATLRRDLCNIVAPAGTLTGSIKSGPTLSEMGRQSMVEFCTSIGTFDDRSPWADVTKVEYALRSPTNGVGFGGKDLVRLTTRNLLASITELPEEQWLLSDVQSMELSFYDGTQWQPTWDSTSEKTALPKAIKVIIDVISQDEDSRLNPRMSTVTQTPIELVVPLFVTAATNQTSSAGGQQ